jgi:hypothetical protein
MFGGAFAGLASPLRPYPIEMKPSLSVLMEVGLSCRTSDPWVISVQVAATLHAHSNAVLLPNNRVRQGNPKWERRAETERLHAANGSGTRIATIYPRTTARKGFARKVLVNTTQRSVA